MDLSITNGGVLCTPQGFLDWDSAQNPSMDFVAGNLGIVTGSSTNFTQCYVRNSPITKSIESAIVLCSRADSNWFHFLIETLPRLLLVEDLVPKHLPVVVNARVPASGLQALRLITSREILEIDANSSTLIRRAVLPGPVIYHPDSQFTWGTGTENQVNAEILSLFRNRILEQVPGPQSATLKTYWSRERSHRGILNNKQVSRASLSFGYIEEDPAEMTFIEQVERIRSSSKLLAVGGALMSNFLFAREGTVISLLTSNIGKNYEMPRILAAIAGARVCIVAGKPPRGYSRMTFLGKLHSSFRIPIRTLRKFL